MDCNLHSLHCQINHAELIEFAWTRAGHNIFRHTGFAILLDKEPKFTIDFGGEVYDILFRPKTASIIKVNEWDHRRFQIQDVLISTRSRDSALQLVDLILKTDIGRYHITNNSCRHFLLQAINKLKSAEEIDTAVSLEKANYKKFKNSFQTVLFQDKLLFSAVFVLVLTFLMLLLSNIVPKTIQMFLLVFIAFVFKLMLL